MPSPLKASCPRVVCVVITGPSGTGKTTFAQILATSTGWPVVSKDQIKEEYFALGDCPSREVSKEIGHKALATIARHIQEASVSGAHLIVEGNLRTSWLEETCRVPSSSTQRFVQVQLSASGEILTSRILARANSGARHPCHFDAEALRENADELAEGSYRDARIPGPVVHLDTTEMNDAAMEEEAQRVERTAYLLSTPARAG